jgi:hypothetical protein
MGSATGELEGWKLDRKKDLVNIVEEVCKDGLFFEGLAEKGV